MPAESATAAARHSKTFRGRDQLSPDEIASLDYILELVETAERISRKQNFAFLSYLLSLPS
jgi:hypothetical protein